MAAHVPIAFARADGSGYSDASRASDAGTIPAAATPSSARPPMSRPTVGAAAQSSDTTAKEINEAR